MSESKRVIKIVALSGSLRKASFNTKLLRLAMETLAKSTTGADKSPVPAEQLHITMVDLKEMAMPFYDGDVESASGMPASAKCFRDLLVQCDGVLIASPEHNGSVSAVLKNALDWASRSETGQASSDALKNKTVAVMSASPGRYGGARSLSNLRVILGNVGARVLARQVCVGDCFKCFDANGALMVPSLQLELAQQMEDFLQSLKSE